MKKWLFLVLAMQASLASAESYFTCRDSDGRTVISNRHCSELRAETLSTELPAVMKSSQGTSKASANREVDIHALPRDKALYTTEEFRVLNLAAIPPRKDKEAQYHLARAYIVGGAGILLNPQEALRWMTSAAEQGHVQAQSDLGKMYYDGVSGGEANFVKARYWLTKAADKGDKKARQLIEELNAQEKNNATSEKRKVKTDAAGQASAVTPSTSPAFQEGPPSAPLPEPVALLVFAGIFFFLPLLLLLLVFSSRRQRKKFVVDASVVPPELMPGHIWQPVHFDVRPTLGKALMTMILGVLMMAMTGYGFFTDKTEIVYMNVIHIPIVVWKIMMVFMVCFILYALAVTVIRFISRHKVSRKIILHENFMEVPKPVNSGSISIPYASIRNVKAMSGGLLPVEILFLSGDRMPSMNIGSAGFKTADEYSRFKRLLFGLVLRERIKADILSKEKHNNPRKW